MISWQKPARFGVATFAVAFAAYVYMEMGDRQAAAPVSPAVRTDPSASAEIVAGVLRRVLGVEEKFQISARSHLLYPDGSSKWSGASIRVPKLDGRDFLIVAEEAKAGADEKVFDLSGGVTVTASDGFELKTESATYNLGEGIARAAGPVTFSKGGMSGAGVGMSFDQRNDVLTISDDSTVTMADAAGAVTVQFSAGPATLNRMLNVLTLDDGVHVMRGTQEFDAERATAQLSEMEEFVTFIELRGKARVAGGGGSLDSMSARDIDLDYSDDGQTLERVLLVGDAGVAMAGAGGAGGRQIFSQRLELTLAADGAVTKATGRDGVRLTLPADEGAPARSMSARTLDGEGAAGKGLTSARFDEAVEYREVNGPRVAREAHSQSLRVALDGDAVTAATFTGRVTFTEPGLEARGGEARYSPVKGTLELSGADAGGRPRVSDEQISLEAATIDLAFESRLMIAKGTVRTTLRMTPPKPTDQRPARPRASKMPGLLTDAQPVSINADTLDYGGGSGKTSYSGDVILRQGNDTVIRANTLALDQDTGNLTATGNARSTLLVDAATSEGSADVIQYDDTKRLIVYSSTAPRLAQLKGPQGDLKAGRIQITLEQEGARARRLDALTSVTIGVGTRAVSGARLEYEAADERYVVSGAVGKPVVVVERTLEGCSESTGMKWTYVKSTGSVTIDGEGMRRTRHIGGGACLPIAPAPPR
jgi:LPS export ABC transporter protein LptC/lipopolysaccharide transport protein LptA